MTAVLIAVDIATWLIACSALAVAYRGPRAGRGPSLVGETIVVHTKHPDDRSIRGVVVGEHADRLVLREAVILVSADARHPIPDLAEVPRAAISWWQRLEARG